MNQLVSKVPSSFTFNIIVSVICEHPTEALPFCHISIYLSSMLPKHHLGHSAVSSGSSRSVPVCNYRSCTCHQASEATKPNLLGYKFCLCPELLVTHWEGRLRVNLSLRSPLSNLCSACFSAAVSRTQARQSPWHRQDSTPPASLCPMEATGVIGEKQNFALLAMPMDFP